MDSVFFPLFSIAPPPALPSPLRARMHRTRYASYQVIFVISGYIFSTVLVAILFLFIAYTIILPAKGLYKGLDIILLLIIPLYK